MRCAPIFVETTRPESLGPGVIHHDVRHDVPGEIGAALEPRFRALQVLRIEIVRVRRGAASWRCTGLVAPETRHDAPFIRILELEMARARGECQHLGYKIEGHRAEEGGLLRFTLGVLIKRFIRWPDPGRDDGATRERA